MRCLVKLWTMATLACGVALLGGSSLAASLEFNSIRQQPVSLGPEAHRLIVGFRTTPANAVTKTVAFRGGARRFSVTQAQTSAADAAALVQRVGMSVARTRQFTPSMHVLYLPQTLYGADLETALAKLRADAAVQFAVVDQRRYPQSVTPDDPLFVPTSGASGQWYMNTPSATVLNLEGNPTKDLSATDAVSAWGITTGSTGIVIADVDTGILFGHPDLLRAGLGGRLLPGYDFVGEDYNPDSPYNALGTYLIANDGDGWDPDPSDPGDWISQSDLSNALFSGDTAEPSSWHGTRVVGIFGAITNNDLGIAGMTWTPWILPVRALGKGGGYDSDIIAGIQWAAGLSVVNPQGGAAIPDNPYPADIVNLSLGGDTTACSSSDGAAYKSALTTVTGMGVLVVIAAGNASGPVELPGNCSTVVPGVMAVAGLRNVGTKVGYSSFGSQVSVSAPAGNCVQTSGDCLRSIDTTSNLGTTVPGANSYTNETNDNLGTSFATPIVAGIAALMRSVNYNLTPTQLVARLQASATPFPQSSYGESSQPPVCSTSSTDECICPNPSAGNGYDSQCGTGMVDAYTAVQAAQAPIAAVAITGDSLNAGGSAAACGRTVASYAWAGSGGATVTTSSGKTTTVSGTGTVTLTVTDNMGGTNAASITVSSSGASSSAPTTAGTSACPTALTITPIAPSVTQAFSPATVGPTIASTLTFTFTNSNAYVLTQSNFSDTVPAGLSILTTPAPSTTCTGAGAAVSATSSVLTLSDANIPQKGSCTVSASVSSSATGTYTNAVAAGALNTGPAGGNSATSSSTLAVAAPNTPTVAESFSPSSVAQNGTSTLTITLSNSNAYALTGVAFTDALPSGLAAQSSPAATNSCGGTLPTPSSSIALSGATIPASGSCSVTVTVSSGTAGSYANSLGAGALKYTPAGAATAAATATLTVTASGGGGGALDWLDIFFAAGVVLAVRRPARAPRGRGETYRRSRR